MKYLVVLILVLGFIGCSKNPSVVKLDSGLQYCNDSLGTGKEANAGSLVSVHFRAWIIKDSTNLFSDWSKDSTRFKSLIGNSIDFGQPIKIKLGESSFIRGIDEGIVGMKAGGWRTIVVPANLAYGEMGYGPIPPNSSLKAEINLVEVKDPIVINPWSIDSSKIVTTNSGLKYVIINPGTNERVDSSDMVTTHYTGFLSNGRIFDSSVETGEPFRFRYKYPPLIPGWDEGIKMIGKGGRIKLIIPPALAYGPTQMGSIPPNSTLTFDLELLDIQKVQTAQK